jgi:hypothetical protein
MDARVVAVLRLLAEMEDGEEIETRFLGDGRTETLPRRHAEVTDLRPEDGVLSVRHGGTVARLHFDEAELLEFIDGAGDEGEEVWGEPLSDEVAAARFLSIHLDESLATREPHESGWWTYRAGGFDPVPPWEAHARRAQEP